MDQLGCLFLIFKFNMRVLNIKYNIRKNINSLENDQIS